MRRYKKGKSSDKKVAAKYLQIATKYCNEYNNEISIQLLQMANSIGDEKERKNFLDNVKIKDIANADQMINATVDYFTKKFGPPNKILNLRETGKWYLIDHVKPEDRIYYIALTPFLRKLKQNVKRYEDSGPYDAYYYRYMPGDDGDVSFAKDKEDVNVYVWVRKK